MLTSALVEETKNEKCQLKYIEICIFKLKFKS